MNYLLNLFLYICFIVYAKHCEAFFMYTKFKFYEEQNDIIIVDKHLLFNVQVIDDGHIDILFKNNDSYYIIIR